MLNEEIAYFDLLAELFDTWGRVCSYPGCDEIRTVGYRVNIQVDGKPQDVMIVCCEKHLHDRVNRDLYQRNFVESI